MKAKDMGRFKTDKRRLVELERKVAKLESNAKKYKGSVQQHDILGQGILGLN